MERFIKRHSGDQCFSGRDLFNESNAWLQEHISPLEKTASGNSEDLVSSANFTGWAKALLMYIQAKGERDDLIESAQFACGASGEGWRTAYVSCNTDQTLFNEVVISIDNDMQALQFKLACL